MAAAYAPWPVASGGTWLRGAGRVLVAEAVALLSRAGLLPRVISEAGSTDEEPPLVGAETDSVEGRRRESCVECRGEPGPSALVARR